jgi:hypothetical protein
MDRKLSEVAPSAPIFTVEVIDRDGFAWLCGPMRLHEALKLSAEFASGAASGREPHVSIPRSLLSPELDDE